LVEAQAARLLKVQVVSRVLSKLLDHIYRQSAKVKGMKTADGAWGLFCMLHVGGYAEDTIHTYVYSGVNRFHD